MDLLDIVIAKQLAGGGGGSGTDNYNDLSNLPKINDTTLSGNKSSSALGLQSEINSDSKLASDLVDDTKQDNKFVTSTEKNTWNGKQNAIDADHKLSSDLVDDANKTNKFVTSTEKNTWNAKQNAIDSDHKLSSDLVDDANKTNKFVTSTEKQTWNAKQNAIDSDHKLSSSLVSFSEAEAAALASGIDSSKVGQISTNQTNILYNLNMGVKNLIRFVPGTFTNNVATFEITNDGKVIINSTSSGSSAITNNYITLPAGTYRQIGISVSGKGDVRLMNGSTRITDNPFTLSAETTLSVVIFSYATNSNVVITPMLCTEEAYAQSTAYQPPALPNYDLTRLQAEDRAGLVECVDGGAKNVLQNIATTKTENNVTFTVNTDGSVKVQTTAAGASAGTNLSLTGTYISNKYGGYVISGISASIPNSIYLYVAYSNNGTSESRHDEVKTGNTLIIDGSYSHIQIILRVQSGTIATTALTVYPMICTKAAFGVSNKFVPYRVPITGVFWKETNETRSTSLVTTGIKFEASKQTIYRITATALRNNSKPTSLVIKSKLGSSYSENTFIQITANENDWALTACGSMVLGVGGYFEVYVQYNSAASNKVYVIVEELTL